MAKRNYTRTEYQKLIRKANDVLRYAEKNKLSNNTLVSVKQALELMNKQLGKKGRTDRFSSDEKLNNDNKNIIETLAKNLLENGNIKEVFGTPQARKLLKEGYSKQDILDLMDNEQDNRKYLQYIEELPSKEKYIIFELTRELDLHGESWENIIINCAKRAENEFLANNNYRSVNPDKLAQYIRDTLYNMVKTK